MFYAMLVFVIYILVQFWGCLNIIFTKKIIKIHSIIRISFFAIDVTVLVFMLIRANYLAESMALWKLDPRAVPTFDKVFQAQRHLIEVTGTIFCVKLVD